MLTFKKFALAGMAALTFGGVAAATASSAEAQAMRPYSYQRNYDTRDGELIPDVAGAAFGTAAAIGGFALGTGAAVTEGPTGNGPGNFGYANWPYGYGYQGGSIEQGRYSPY